MRLTHPAIIWDLDNTLCECGVYYRQAEEQLAELLTQHTGLPVPFLRELFSRIDVHATSLKGGWNANRFPSAMAATAAAALQLVGNHDHDASELAHEARTIATAVFDAPYALYHGVEQLLREHQRRGWVMVLYTKGDPSVQWNKFYSNALYRFFAPSNVRVVDRKTDQKLAHLIDTCHIDVSTSWYVGDSLRDDIAPAQRAGLRSIWVRHEDSHWAYETEEAHPTYTVSNVDQTLDLIPARDPGKGVRIGAA